MSESWFRQNVKFNKMADGIDVDGARQLTDEEVEVVQNVTEEHPKAFELEHIQFEVDRVAGYLKEFAEYHGITQETAEMLRNAADKVQEDN